MKLALKIQEEGEKEIKFNEKTRMKKMKKKTDGATLRLK